ncbi:Zinc finger protein CONSTANS-LIKE 12, partial [Mucuna pruriens]
MEPLCEFCGVVRAVVYCKSDSARLCLHCDGCVHSANSLSRRHSRSLLCDKCNSQPAMIRCVDHKLSLCQGCDWNPNDCSVLGHRRLPLNCYTGCPSLAEFSRIWSFMFDANSSFGGWESLGTLAKSESCNSQCLEQPDHNNGGSFGLVSDKLDEIESCVRYEPWLGQSQIIPSNPNYTQYGKDHAFLFPQDSNQPKQECPNLGIHDGNELCEGLNVDSVQLNFESADEIFGCSQAPTRYNLEDGGMDCLLMDKNISVTESSSLIESAMEASSTIQQDCVAFQSSRAGGPASVIQAINSNTNCALMNPSCSRNISLGFPQGQVHSNIPLQLPNIVGEKTSTEYQDCGLSQFGGYMPGEPPWESNLEGTCPQARDKAKMRYNEKKKTRTFGKQIRYASRKARADTRKRVKGRFVKAGEAYDYDPLVTRDI